MVKEKLIELEKIKDWTDMDIYLSKYHKKELRRKYFRDDLIHQFNDYAIKHAVNIKSPIQITKRAMKDLVSYVKEEGWK